MQEETMKHLKEHVNWPATGQEILDACEEMSDVDEMDKKKIEEMVDPDKTYATPEELLGNKEEEKEDEDGEE